MYSFLFIYFSIGFLFVVIMLAKGVRKIKAIPAIKENEENKKLVNNLLVATLSAYFFWEIIIIQFLMKEYKRFKKADDKKVS
jgi:hypothetical protein